MWCSEHYLESTSQQLDCGIEAWTKCVTVNIIWKILHSMWTVLFQLKLNVIKLSSFGRYITQTGQWYCSLNAIWYSEHYLQDTLQQVDSGFAVWKKCDTLNIIWKILHGCRLWYCSLIKCLQVNIKRNLGQLEETYNKWTLLFWSLNCSMSRVQYWAMHTLEFTEFPAVK